jgi:ATP-dependent protease ClpP protease subunit
MNNNLNQQKPIQIKVYEELANTNTYDASIALCKSYISEIEAITQRRLVTYFAAPIDKSIAYINDDDPVYIEDLLRVPSHYPGLDLIINSNGGMALSAERIINVCQNYVQKQNNEEFRIIVPKVAKSAATIVALGADRILLCENSELGPIDPQITIQHPTGQKITKSAYLIVKAVEELTNKANSLIPSKNQRYLAFLNQYNYDIYTVAKNELSLSKDITQKIIERKKSRYNNLTFEDFKIFTDPEKTLSHGRLIGIKDLYEKAICSVGFVCDINDFFLNKISPKLDEQKINRLSYLIWELYIRKNMLLVDTGNWQIKVIEDCNWRFIIRDPDWQNPQTIQQNP